MENEILLLTQVRSVEVGLLDRLDEILDRRGKGPDSTYHVPKNFEYSGATFSKKQYDLIALVLILKFRPEYFRDYSFYLEFEISSYLEKNLLFPFLEAALQCPVQDFIYIILKYSTLDQNMIYSAVLQEKRINKVINSIHLLETKYKKPKRLQRHKGYRDHGSQRPNHRWLPSSSPSFDRWQNELEEKRSNYQREVSTIVRDCGGRYLNYGINSET